MMALEQAASAVAVAWINEQQTARYKQTRNDCRIHLRSDDRPLIEDGR